MRQMRGWVLMIGALMFAMVILLPFFALAQEAPVLETVPTITAAPAMDATTVMIVLAALLAISEALSLIPAVKANGVLQLVMAVLRRVLGRPAVPVVLLVGFAFGLAGCGKSLDQIRQAAHALIDIGGKIYEDVKDDVGEVKKVWQSDPPVPGPAQP